jgi:myo-inositol-1-phosphate synthase
MSPAKNGSTPSNVKPADGKLGILLPGMGAVASTFIAGVLSSRKGLTRPFGSLTQMGTIRIGARSEDRFPLINEYVPLAQLNDIEFGGWDIFPDNMFEVCSKAEVLEEKHIQAIKEELSAIAPMPAVFSSKYIKNISGPNQKNRDTLGKSRSPARRHSQLQKNKKLRAPRDSLVWIDRSLLQTLQRPRHNCGL